MPILGVIASSAKGAPGIPTGVTATDVGTARAFNNGAASVAFTPGAGATATSFTVTSSPGGFTATGASSPLTVTGLQSGVGYTYTVTATNAAGTSAASAASASVTATTVPAAPTIGTATCATGQAYTGSANITVPFTAGATGGKTITTFTATSSGGGTATNSASPITISRTVGTSYTFTVTATNANGTSTASGTSNSVLSASVPQAPTIGTATAVSSTSATVGYTANATGGSAVTTFTATSSPGSLTGTGASPITVSGLTTGTAYTFTVRATNAYGTSTASAASNSVTPAIATGYYAIAHAVLSSDSTVTFSSIPQGYTDLKIVASLYISNSAASATIQFNGVTSGYARYLVRSSGATSSNSTNGGDIYAAYNISSSTPRSTSIIDIPSYSNTAKEKTFLGYQGHQYGGSPSSATASYNLPNTAAISSITVIPALGSMSGTMTLYAIKAAS